MTEEMLATEPGIQTRLYYDTPLGRIDHEHPHFTATTATGATLPGNFRFLAHRKMGDGGPEWIECYGPTGFRAINVGPEEDHGGIRAPRHTLRPMGHRDSAQDT